MTLAADIAALRAAIALEARSRDMSAVRPDVLSGAFPAQLAFIRDASPLKASFCTRRAAKSYSVGLEYVNDSYDFPRAHYLFLMTVRAQAKRDFWNDVLKEIDREFGLGMVFNESDLIAKMPNGAMIYVGGADSSADEWRKLIAGKYRKVHVDEAQGFIHADLRNLVYEAFKPAVADYRGSIGMSGTPGLLNKGLFFDVTHGRETGWSLHRWLTSDNPYMAEKIAAEIEELKRLKPGVEKTPWFRRNYLGEWVLEDTDRVYRYLPGRNDFRELPVYSQGEWHYVNGTDLGYNDPTSWVKMAYHDYDPCLYILSAEKESGLDVTAVARRTQAKMRETDYDALVVDNANKQAVEEMRKRHDIPWKPADKTGKADFIEIMNGEFMTSRIRLKEGPDCDPLREEYASLVWDKEAWDRRGKREELAACDNHCTDGALYGWRYCFQYLSNILVSRPVPGSPEALAEVEDSMEALQEEMYRKQQEEEEGDVWG